MAKHMTKVMCLMYGFRDSRNINPGIKKEKSKLGFFGVFFRFLLFRREDKLPPATYHRFISCSVEMFVSLKIALSHTKL